MLEQYAQQDSKYHVHAILINPKLPSVLILVHISVFQAAHRTYLGVMKTIKPDFNLMARLFASRNLTWPEFRRSVLEGHRNRVGQVTLREPTQSISCTGVYVY
jgi:hypothetical protein